MYKTCFGKCYGCKWDCEYLYQNKRGEPITDDDRNRAKAMDEYWENKAKAITNEYKDLGEKFAKLLKESETRDINRKRSVVRAKKTITF